MHKDVMEREDIFAFEYGKVAKEFTEYNLKKFAMDNLNLGGQRFAPSLYADSINKPSSQLDLDFSRYSLARL